MTLQNVSRRFGTTKALDNLSLQICQGEFLSLLGPSGCGKTTLLRLIAGLDTPSQGRILLNGQDVHSTPAHKRPVNTVFQSYALFPHLNVHENIAFGLRMKKVPPPTLLDRVQKVMDLVEISPLAQRKPEQLSGGQRQRVALARALVNEPEVLLLDEPLGALDLKLRQQLQLELRQLQKRLGITFLYVTHDQEEALTLSDRIAVMRDGIIEQIDRAHVVYEEPQTPFVARFLGSCNVFPVQTVEDAPHGGVFQTEFGRLQVHHSSARQRFSSHDRLYLAIRPEKVRIEASVPENETMNTFHARITETRYAGSQTHYSLQLGKVHLNATRWNESAPGKPQFRSGTEVAITFPASSLCILKDHRT